MGMAGAKRAKYRGMPGLANKDHSTFGSRCDPRPYLIHGGVPNTMKGIHLEQVNKCRVIDACATEAL